MKRFSSNPRAHKVMDACRLRSLPPPKATFLVYVIGCWMGCLPTLGVRPARAAESDPYYAWLRPPQDTSAPLNVRINQKFEAALTELNRMTWAKNMSCAEVASFMVWPLWGTAMWYFVGGMNDLGMSPVPSTNTELRERYAPHSIYQYSRLWKWGFIVPPDPTVRVAGINFSTDKLGHFFHEGREYFAAWQQAQREGRAAQEAHEIAIWNGIRDENMIQGDIISGIFSYADLEANEQGFRFFHRLCATDSPDLRWTEAGWNLVRPFDIRDWVNPCWDESFYPSAFAPSVGQGVKKALRFYCPLRSRAHVQQQRNFYRTLGCTSFSYFYLDELRRAGWIPDNAPYDVEALCSIADPGASPTTKDSPTGKSNTDGLFRKVHLD